MSDRQRSELSLQDDKIFFNNGSNILNDHINCIIILLLLVDLHHFKRNTANLKILLLQRIELTFIIYYWLPNSQLYLLLSYDI